jgi:hypothetical protein
MILSRKVEYQVGQEVLLSTANKHFKGTGVNKLRPRWVGPFTITELVDSVALRLALHDAWRGMHPVFHGSLIKPMLVVVGYLPLIETMVNLGCGLIYV